jgi:hypothetical protein
MGGSDSSRAWEIPRYSREVGHTFGMNSDRPPDHPNRRITKLAFDQRAVPEIGALLGVESSLAPFNLPGADVHQMTIQRPDAPPTVLLTLWPSLKRVDAVSQSATVVFTNVSSVELVEGVEVIFRRMTGEYLIVTVAGKVIVRS